MSNELLIKNFTASGAVGAYTLAAYAATDGQAKQAAAVTDAPIGVFDELGHADTESADVITHGIPLVLFGGTVAAGDPLTTDSSGRAVKAVPAIGVNNRIWGFAMQSAVVGDINRMRIAPGYLQG